MASKQLGKLRQWAGEVISSRDKTTVTEEFQELEKDIELRRDGAQKLLLASDMYQHALSKKKKSDVFEDAAQLLPIDLLGMVMIFHGEDFGEDSAFGTSLVKLGHAHCKVATLQEAYALTFKDTFLGSVEKFLEEIKEFELQRKKLESRRLSYDAAVTKFEKLRGGKKEKDKREAEDEMDKAKHRYEETSDDVRARMHAIQENEIVQLQELTSFLDLEINFVQQYLDVLKDTRSDWHNSSSLAHTKSPRANGPTHVFSRSSYEGDTSQSRRSSPPNPKDSSESSNDDEFRPRSSGSRRSSTNRRSESNTSKPSSRPASRASRKRADSSGTIGEKEEKEKSSRRMSVADWASSAVGSVTGRGKKGRDKFAALHDDTEDGKDVVDDEQSPTLKKSSSFHSISAKLSRDRSKESLQGASPKAPARILKPPSLQGKKIVRALHNFSGGIDELTFRAGDEIVVVNEVLDGWWMGELEGTKGLFPTSYVEVLAARPSLPRRQSDSASGPREKEAIPSVGTWKQSLVSDSDGGSYMDSDLDEDHLDVQPLVPNHNSPYYGGPPDAASITSSVTEDEDEKHLVSTTRNTKAAYRSDEDTHVQSYSARSSPRIPDRKISHSVNSLSQPIRQSTTIDIMPRSLSSIKKAPPPPPPRRPANNLQVASPPIPDRPYKTRTQSIGGLAPTPASSISTNSYDRSPFESVTDLPSST